MLEFVFFLSILAHSESKQEYEDIDQLVSHFSTFNFDVSAGEVRQIDFDRNNVTVIFPPVEGTEVYVFAEVSGKRVKIGELSKEKYGVHCGNAICSFEYRPLKKGKALIHVIPEPKGCEKVFISTKSRETLSLGQSNDLASQWSRSKGICFFHIPNSQINYNLMFSGENNDFTAVLYSDDKGEGSIIEKSKAIQSKSENSVFIKWNSTENSSSSFMYMGLTESHDEGFSVSYMSNTSTFYLTEKGAEEIDIPNGFEDGQNRQKESKKKEEIAKKRAEAEKSTQQSKKEDDSDDEKWSKSDDEYPNKFSKEKEKEKPKPKEEEPDLEDNDDGKTWQTIFKQSNKDKEKEERKEDKEELKEDERENENSENLIKQQKKEKQHSLEQQFKQQVQQQVNQHNRQLDDDAGPFGEDEFPDKWRPNNGPEEPENKDMDDDNDDEDQKKPKIRKGSKNKNKERKKQNQETEIKLTTIIIAFIALLIIIIALCTTVILTRFMKSRQESYVQETVPFLQNGIPMNQNFPVYPGYGQMPPNPQYSFPYVD